MEPRVRSDVDLPASKPKLFWELDDLSAKPIVLTGASGYP